ncbi:MAG TPA: FHA domain-containing protein [Gemmatimonadaceae bacterium]
MPPLLATAQAAGWLRLLHEQTGREIWIGPEGAILGREGDVQHRSVFQGLMTISRRHCRIERTASGEWWVHDLNSAWGTDCRSSSMITPVDLRRNTTTSFLLRAGYYLRMSDVVFRIELHAGTP